MNVTPLWRSYKEQPHTEKKRLQIFHCFQDAKLLINTSAKLNIINSTAAKNFWTSDDVLVCDIHFFDIAAFVNFIYQFCYPRDIRKVVHLLLADKFWGSTGQLMPALYCASQFINGPLVATYNTAVLKSFPQYSFIRQLQIMFCHLHELTHKIYKLRKQDELLSFFKNEIGNRIDDFNQQADLIDKIEIGEGITNQRVDKKTFTEECVCDMNAFLLLALGEYEGYTQFESIKMCIMTYSTLLLALNMIATIQEFVSLNRDSDRLSLLVNGFDSINFRRTIEKDTLAKIPIMIGMLNNLDTTSIERLYEFMSKVQTDMDILYAEFSGNLIDFKLPDKYHDVLISPFTEASNKISSEVMYLLTLPV